jgi:hypothetical protein
MNDSPGSATAAPGAGALLSAEADSLERAIRAVAPDAFLVERRVLRRVIRLDRGVGLFDIATAQRSCYAIDARRALRVLELDELGLSPSDPLPPTLILLARPSTEERAELSSDQLLTNYWRLLYGCRVHAALSRQVGAGALPRAALLERIDQIGQAPFDEIRAVLRQESLLGDEHDLAASYVEFVTLYAELRQFAPSWLPHYFPSLGDPARIDALIAEDVELDGILDATRPLGAPERPWAEPADDERPEGPPDEEGDDEPPGTAIPPPGRAGRQHRWLIRWADWAAARGNVVRAAMCRLRAARLVSPRHEAQERLEAMRELERLAERLGAALGLDEDTVLAWGRALAGLLGRAAQGLWSPEARLLYDLQKIVVEHGREVYAVDLVAWARSLGKMPINRLLPHHAEVLKVKHLRSARRRLARVHLGEAERDRLTRLLHDALERAEATLRDVLRPGIGRTLDGMGWQPRNLPEQVARGKLTEELLDRIVERGFLSMGDLRDAVSRGDLKLPDLAGPREFWKGDRLLATDRALGHTLDGIYRPGEIYLRWLQRASLLAFGTALGRRLTRYVAMPFGGAFVLLEGMDHLINPIRHWMGYRHHLHLFNRDSFLVLGLFLLGLINHEGFRRGVGRAVSGIGRLLRVALVDPLDWLLGRAIVQAILRSRAFEWFFRWGIKPLIFGLGALVCLIPWTGPRQAVHGAVAIYALSAALINTRRGRDFEEIIADRADRLWHRFRFNLLPGLFRLIVEVSNRLLEAVERVLYALDEWLRFRTGEHRWTVAAKAVLGVFWFAITYVVRFAVNLVIEPQVNPIKHFPVVTVAHKVFFPVILALYNVIKGPPLYLGRDIAGVIAFALQFIIPGIFGFLVWELKENWKLFEANRRRGLQPVLIGEHGETMARLVRPGFHSGTLPKLYARLRRADRKPPRPGRRSPVRKYREAIHRVEIEVRHFVERELLPLLEASRSLQGLRCSVGAIAPGTNRITVALEERGHAGDPVRLEFEEQSGWLVAAIARPGWLDAVDEEARRAFRDALTGLYKRAGVDLVREQIRAVLGPEVPPYDIADRGLIIWTGGDYRTERVERLDRHRTFDFEADGAAPQRPADRPVAARLYFGGYVLSWRRWVEIWRRDRDGEGHPEPAIPGVEVVPPRGATAMPPPAEQERITT